MLQILSDFKNGFHDNYGIHDNIMLMILQYQKFTFDINYHDTLISR